MAGTWFFDLDGTLTDPREGITRCIQYALEELGERVPPTDALTGYIGPPLHGTFAELVGEARVEEAVRLYRERFAGIGWRENIPYPGIAEALAALREQGATLHVATSKPRVFAERIVEHFGLAGYFTRVFGCELDGTHGDKSDLLHYALSEVPVDGRATMIGDRKFDMLAAQAHGLRPVGVTWGYGSVAELEESGAELLLDAPGEILTRA